MRYMVWKYGFRIWSNNFSISLLGPKNERLFSERKGYHKPVFRIGCWRFFIDRFPRERKVVAERFMINVLGEP